MFEIGRICIKTAGREAGRFCVVIAKDKEKDFLIVTGPRAVTNVRRRKCNFRHLEPTPFAVDIKDDATDEDVLKAFERDDVFSKLKISRPDAEHAKAAEERKEKREEAKAEKEQAKEGKEERAEPAKKEARKKEAKPKEHKEHKESKAEKKKAKKE